MKGMSGILIVGVAAAILFSQFGAPGVVLLGAVLLFALK